jgi:hypothetical protein
MQVHYVNMGEAKRADDWDGGNLWRTILATSRERRRQ